AVRASVAANGSVFGRSVQSPGGSPRFELFAERTRHQRQRSAALLVHGSSLVPTEAGRRPGLGGRATSRAARRWTRFARLHREPTPKIVCAHRLLRGGAGTRRAASTTSSPGVRTSVAIFPWGTLTLPASGCSSCG